MIKSVAVKAGNAYWVAVLARGGTLYFRERRKGSSQRELPEGPFHRVAILTHLSSLKGRHAHTCPISAYVSGKLSASGRSAPKSGGNPNTVTSSADATGQHRRPTISGTTAVGDALIARAGAWTNCDSGACTFTYQWEHCDGSPASCTAVSGAAYASYTLQASDVGDTIDVVVTATNAGGSAGKRIRWRRAWLWVVAVATLRRPALRCRRSMVARTTTAHIISHRRAATGGTRRRFSRSVRSGGPTVPESTWAAVHGTPRSTLTRRLMSRTSRTTGSTRLSPLSGRLLTRHLMTIRSGLNLSTTGILVGRDGRAGGCIQFAAGQPVLVGERYVGVWQDWSPLRALLVVRLGCIFQDPVATPNGQHAAL